MFPRLLTAGLVLMITAVAFEGLAAPTVMPATLDELGSVELYGWTFSGFWLANLVGIVLAGAEADRRGPFWPFAAGVIAFAGGLVAAGLAPEMGWVVAGRGIQGLGAGAISAITYVAIARGYASGDQPRMIAVISSAWVIPGLVGPAVAGWLAEAHSWRWVFLGLAPLLPLAALTLAGPLRRLPPIARERTPPGAGHAVRDAVQLTLGAALVLGAASWGQPAFALLSGGVGLVVALPALRRLLPPGTLTARPGRGATIAVLGLLSVAFFGVEAFVPLAVASVRNAGTIVGGMALTAAAVTWATGSWIQARLAGTRSRRGIIIAGLVLVAVGIVLETAVPLTSVAPTWVAAAAWAIAGLGMGLAYSTATLTVIESAPAGGEGAASASAQLANTIGIAIGTGGGGAVVALGAGGSIGLAGGIVVANLLMLGLLTVGIAVARGIPAGRLQDAGTAHAGAGVDHGPALTP